MKIGRDTAHMFGLFLAIVAVLVALDSRQSARLDRIEATQAAHGERLAALEAGQAALEAGQAALEAGLAGLRVALAATNERLARLEGAVAVALGRLFPPPPDGAEAPATQ